MQVLYRIAADITVTVHLGYVLFVVLGQLLILAGAFRDWAWIRNQRFRIIHLAAILIVLGESVLGITCPLTTLEKWLRNRAGRASYEGGFVGNAIHDLLFVELSPLALGICYGTFGLLVVVTFFAVPPDWSSKRSSGS